MLLRVKVENYLYLNFLLYDIYGDRNLYCNRTQIPLSVFISSML